MSGENLLYLDTGALLNILATNHAADILQAIPYRCAITEEVKNTSLHFWNNTPTDEPPIDRKQAPITALVYHNLIDIHQCDKKQHIATYVKLASHVPDKQASILTLVITKGATLTSDDLRTREVLRTLFPDTPVISTLTLLHVWQKNGRLPHNGVRDVALTLRYQAQFIPPEDDPLLIWWKNMVEEMN